MSATIFITPATLHSLLPLHSLISHLRSSLPSLSSSILSPHRHSHPVPSSPSSSLLLMPALSSSPHLPYLGVKLVTSFPLHSPSVHSTYSLFSSSSGSPLALFDADPLTLLRTAAVSALASSFLSIPDAKVLVLLGAGALAPYLINAHRTVRPGIQRVIVWNRNPDKARSLVSKLTAAGENNGVTFEFAECLDDVVGLGDVVSCATSSQTALVKGERLKPGAHLDLVGSFSPSMRECDDGALARGRVFVDFEAAMEEAGELVGAFERGVLTRDDVVGTLVELVAGTKVGRRNDDEVTVFKSVGNAIVDLLAAQLAYETFLKGNDVA